MSREEVTTGNKPGAGDLDPNGAGNPPETAALDDASRDTAAERAMSDAVRDIESGATPEVSLVEDPDAPVAAGPPDSIASEEFASDIEGAADAERVRLKAVIEAMIYITDEPLTLQQIANATGRPTELIREVLDALTEEYALPDRGLSIRELAGGYKMSTKPEHHEEIRQLVKNLKPPLKLSLAALETLAVIAYKQPITAPEIMEIRGVQGAGVLKTLLDRKLIAAAGRKNVVGKPILYKTTREFLIQFGLKDLSELPTLKEFEELGRLALTDEPAPSDLDAPQPPPPADEPPVEEPGPDPTPVEEPPAPPDEQQPPEKVDASETGE